MFGVLAAPEISYMNESAREGLASGSVVKCEKKQIFSKLRPRARVLSKIGTFLSNEKSNQDFLDLQS